MVEIYNFLVAHPRPGHDLNLVRLYPVLKEWVHKAVGKVDRCGGKNGGVIKFSEDRYVKELEGGKIKAVELYSERIFEKGEVRETLNCEGSALLAKDEGMVLSVASGKMDISRLVDSLFEYPEWWKMIDYAYAYSESHAYGFGYAQGIHTIDERHPLTWSGGDEAIMWLKMKWAGKQDAYIRDVYPVNIFSDRKLSALPPEKRLALELAMKEFGMCDVQGRFTVWALDDHELENVRAKLKAVELLASYCP